MDKTLVSSGGRKDREAVAKAAQEEDSKGPAAELREGQNVANHARIPIGDVQECMPVSAFAPSIGLIATDARPVEHILSPLVYSDD